MQGMLGGMNQQKMGMMGNSGMMGNMSQVKIGLYAFYLFLSALYLVTSAFKGWLLFFPRNKSDKCKWNGQEY